MSERDTQAKGPVTSAGPNGLGLGQFSMSAVGAAETEEASEVANRAWRMITWLIVLTLIVGGIVWWFRAGSFVFYQPTEADQNFIAQLSSKVPAVQQGMIAAVKFHGPYQLKFEIPGSVALQDKNVQPAMRQGIIDLVIQFGVYRPNQELSVEGYQEDEKVAEGRLGVRDTKPWVHLEGERMGPEENRSIE